MNGSIVPNSSCNAAWPVAARLAAGLVLMGGEITICWGAVHPRVDSEYRAHFISKPASCWIPQPLRGTARAQAPRGSFAVKDLVWPQSCAILRAGWMLESWGAWSVGPAAILRLPVGPQTRHVVLDLSAPGYLKHDQTLTIATASGKPPVVAAVAPGGRASVAITLESADVVDGWADLDITIGAPRSPVSMGVSADDRLLGIGLLAVHLADD
jgi:hypothetical protein